MRYQVAFMIKHWIEKYNEKYLEGLHDENVRFEIVRMNHQVFGALGVVPIYLGIFIYYQVYSLVITSLVVGAIQILFIYTNQTKKAKFLSAYLFIPVSLASVCYVDNTLGKNATTYILYYLTFIEILVSILNNRVSVFVGNVLSIIVFAGISIYFDHSLLLDDSVPQGCITVYKYFTNFIFVGSLIFYIAHSMTKRKEYVRFLEYEKIARQESEHKLEQDNLILEIQKQDAEYRILKNQLNPHFVYNTLETIKYLYKNDSQKCDTFIMHLSDFLRISLKNDSGIVEIKQELSMLDDYYNLQSTRFPDSISLNITVDTAIYNKQIPYFSLVTLVENATKHNTFTHKNPLKIDIWSNDDYVYVKNNIQKKKIAETSTGIGLNNLKERYKFLYKSDLIVEHNTDSFLVKLKIIH